MAPKGTKRASGGAAKDAELTKRLRTSGVTKSKYNALVEAIEHPMAEGFSEECRAMLTSALPLSLCVPGDQRHEIQQEVVDMIGTFISGVAEKLKAAVEAETSASAEVLAKEQSLAATVETTTAALTAAKEQLEACKTTLGTATTEHAAKSVAYTKSQEDQKKGDREMNAQAKEKEKVEAVLLSLTTVTSGSTESGPLKDHVKAVSTLANKLSLEKSLLEAMPSSLAKEPAARGPFDQMILQQLGESFKKKVEELTASLAALAPASEERAKAVADAESAMNGAKEAKETASEAVRVASEKVAEAITAKSAADTAKEEHAPASTAATEALEAKKAEAEAFDATKLIYEELRDKTSKKPEEPEPAAAEPAAETAA